MVPIGVLVSGRGSNLEAILDAVDKHYITKGQVKVVISNRPNTPALDIAKKHNVPGIAVDDHQFIDEYRHHIMNVHPALLPSFPGLEAQKQALEHGAKIAGCTVHFAEKTVDAGPIILQAQVPVREDDTVDSLSARILREEHRIYPEAARLFTEDKLRVEGRRVIIQP